MAGAEAVRGEASLLTLNFSFTLRERDATGGVLANEKYDGTYFGPRENRLCGASEGALIPVQRQF